jgi:hypothetical protein
MPPLLIAAVLASIVAAAGLAYVFWRADDSEEA